MRNKNQITFEHYKEELDLIHAQNPVECDLSSFIIGLIRTAAQGDSVSIRDVTTRRRTDHSRRFFGEEGFPDFIVLERSKNAEPDCLGAIEVKYLHIDLDKEERQLRGHINSFGKVIHTNGLKWRYYDADAINSKKEPRWEVVLGTVRGSKSIMWEPSDKWADLLRRLDEIDWFRS